MSEINISGVEVTTANPHRFVHELAEIAERHDSMDSDEARVRFHYHSDLCDLALKTPAPVEDVIDQLTDLQRKFRVATVVVERQKGMESRQQVRINELQKDVERFQREIRIANQRFQQVTDENRRLQEQWEAHEAAMRDEAVIGEYLTDNDGGE